MYFIKITVKWKICQRKKIYNKKWSHWCSFENRRRGNRLSGKEISPGSGQQNRKCWIKQLYKYWRDVKTSYQGQPWCGAFVSWCFMKAFGQENRNHKIRRQKHICIITPGDLKSQRLQRQERKSPETHLDRRCQHHLRPQNLSGIQKRGSCRRRRMRTRNLERPDRDLKNKNAGTPVNSRVSGISCKLASLLNSGPGGNWTRVRKPIHWGISHHSRCFNIPSAVRPPTGLQIQ